MSEDERRNQYFLSRATKRLNRDLKLILTDPIPDIDVAPNEDDILDWHFAIHGKNDTPYKNGVYHGRLVFPPTFPYGPPRILFLTPNGRFKVNERVCFSLSDFHPEEWKPAYSVTAVLRGVYDFMHGSTETIGSIESSVNVREQLAADSMKYNLNNTTFCKLFPQFCNEDIETNNDLIEPEDAIVDDSEIQTNKTSESTYTYKTDLDIKISTNSNIGYRPVATQDSGITYEYSTLYYNRNKDNTVSEARSSPIPRYVDPLSTCHSLTCQPADTAFSLQEDNQLGCINSWKDTRMGALIPKVTWALPTHSDQPFIHNHQARKASPPIIPPVQDFGNLIDNSIRYNVTPMHVISNLHENIPNSSTPTTPVVTPKYPTARTPDLPQAIPQYDTTGPERIPPRDAKIQTPLPPIAMQEYIPPIHFVGQRNLPIRHGIINPPFRITPLPIAKDNPIVNSLLRDSRANVHRYPHTPTIDYPVSPVNSQEHRGMKVRSIPNYKRGSSPTQSVDIPRKKKSSKMLEEGLLHQETPGINTCEINCYYVALLIITILFGIGLIFLLAILTISLN